MRHSGEMHQVVTLRKPIPTTDKFGQRTTWETIADVAARVAPITEHEFFAAGATQSPANMEVEIYYRPDVRANWRLFWMGREYEIVSSPMDVDARHVSLMMMCREAATVIGFTGATSGSATPGIMVRIEGLDGLRDRLLELPAKLRKRAIRNALAKGARLVRDEARRVRRLGTGVESRGALQTTYTRGSVERAITVRTSKVARQEGNIGVFVNVRPVRFGAGRYNPADPFYWQFLEFGTKSFRPGRGAPFLRPGALKLGDALKVFAAELGAQIQKLETNPRDPL